MGSRKPLSIPERTAELAERYPGVKRCHEMGLNVRHYLDARDGLEIQWVDEPETEVNSGRLETQKAILDSEMFWGVGVGSPDRMTSREMEP